MPINHTPRYTVTLAPTPAQRAELQHLSWLAGLIRCLAHDQARLIAAGQDVSVAGMIDAGQDHPDRSLEAEARALQNVAETRGTARNLLEAALLAGRADFAAQRPPRRIDFPHNDICGAGLITPSSARGVTVAGVTGEVNLDTAQLPRWAAQIWTWTASAAPTRPALNGAGPRVIDHAYISPLDDSHFERWGLTVTYR